MNIMSTRMSKWAWDSQLLNLNKILVDLQFVKIYSKKHMYLVRNLPQYKTICRNWSAWENKFLFSLFDTYSRNRGMWTNKFNVLYSTIRFDDLSVSWNRPVTNKTKVSRQKRSHDRYTNAE